MKDRIEKMRDFWDDRHLAGDPRYVTGRSGIAGLRQLFPSFPSPLKGVVILCIGVGDGVQVRELVAEGALVHGADISQVGLTNVSDVLSGSYLFPNFDEIPSDFFDAVFSRAVACHLDDPTLQCHLRHSLRSLKQTGIMFLQINSSDEDITANSPAPSLELMQDGGVHRSLDHVVKMITECGGILVEPVTIFPFPLPSCESLVWHGIQARRSE